MRASGLLEVLHQSLRGLTKTGQWLLPSSSRTTAAAATAATAGGTVSTTQALPLPQEAPLSAAPLGAMTCTTSPSPSTTTTTTSTTSTSALHVSSAWPLTRSLMSSRTVRDTAAPDPSSGTEEASTNTSSLWPVDKADPPGPPTSSHHACTPAAATTPTRTNQAPQQHGLHAGTLHGSPHAAHVSLQRLDQACRALQAQMSAVRPGTGSTRRSHAPHAARAPAALRAPRPGRTAGATPAALQGTSRAVQVETALQEALGSGQLTTAHMDRVLRLLEVSGTPMSPGGVAQVARTLADHMSTAQPTTPMQPDWGGFGVTTGASTTAAALAACSLLCHAARMQVLGPPGGGHTAATSRDRHLPAASHSGRRVSATTLSHAITVSSLNHMVDGVAAEVAGWRADGQQGSGGLRAADRLCGLVRDMGFLRLGSAKAWSAVCDHLALPTTLNHLHLTATWQDWASLLEGLAAAPTHASSHDCTHMVCQEVAHVVKSRAWNHSTDHAPEPGQAADIAPLASNHRVLLLPSTPAVSTPPTPDTLSKVLLATTQLNLSQGPHGTPDSAQHLAVSLQEMAAGRGGELLVVPQLSSAAGALAARGWLDVSGKRSFGRLLLDAAAPLLLRLEPNCLVDLARVAAGAAGQQQQLVGDPGVTNSSGGGGGGGGVGWRRERELRELRGFADQVAVQLRYDLEALDMDQLAGLLEALASCDTRDKVLLQRAAHLTAQRLAPQATWPYEATWPRTSSSRRQGPAHPGHAPDMTTVVNALRTTQALQVLGQPVQPLLHACVLPVSQLPATQLGPWLGAAPPPLLADLALACAAVQQGPGGDPTHHNQGGISSTSADNAHYLFAELVGRLAGGPAAPSGPGAPGPLSHATMHPLDQLSADKLASLVSAHTHLTLRGSTAPVSSTGQVPLLAAVAGSVARRAAAGQLQVHQLVQLAGALQAAGMPLPRPQLATAASSCLSGTGSTAVQRQQAGQLSVQNACELLHALSCSPAEGTGPEQHGLSITASERGGQAIGSVAMHAGTAQLPMAGSPPTPVPAAAGVHGLLVSLAQAVLPEVTALARDEHMHPASYAQGGGDGPLADAEQLQRLAELPGRFLQCEPSFRHPPLAARCAEVLSRDDVAAQLTAPQLVAAATALARLSTAAGPLQAVQDSPPHNSISTTTSVDDSLQGYGSPGSSMNVSDAQAAAAAAAPALLQRLGQQVSDQLLADVPPAALLDLMAAYQEGEEEQGAGVTCAPLKLSLARYLQLHTGSMSPDQVLRCAHIMLQPPTPPHTATPHTQASMPHSAPPSNFQGRGGHVRHMGSHEQQLQPEVQQRLYAALSRRALAGAGGAVGGAGQVASEAPAWSSGQLLDLVRVGLAAHTYHTQLFKAAVSSWLAAATQLPSSAGGSAGSLSDRLSELRDVCTAASVGTAHHGAVDQGDGHVPQDVLHMWTDLTEQGLLLLQAATASGVLLHTADLARVVWAVACQGPWQQLGPHTSQAAEALLLAAAPHLTAGYAQLRQPERLRLAQAYGGALSTLPDRLPTTSACGQGSGSGDPPAAHQQALLPLWLQDLGVWMDTAAAAAAAGADDVGGARQGLQQSAAQDGSGSNKGPHTVLYTALVLRAVAHMGGMVPEPLLTASLRVSLRAFTSWQRAVLSLQDPSASPRSRRKVKERQGRDEVDDMHAATLQLTADLAHALAGLRLGGGGGAATPGSSPGVQGWGAVVSEGHDADDGVGAAVSDALGVLLPAAAQAVGGCRDAELLHALVVGCTALSTAGLEGGAQEVQGAGRAGDENAPGSVERVVASVVGMEERQRCVDVARAGAVRLRKLRQLSEGTSRQRKGFVNRLF